MVKLVNSLNSWGSPEFKETLKYEIEQLGVEQLPLQQGLTYSSYATDSGFSAVIISVYEDDNFLHAKAGIFYSGVIAGCNCADDPTPVPEQSEYCEILLDIRKISAQTRIVLHV